MKTTLKLILLMLNFLIVVFALFYQSVMRDFGFLSCFHAFYNPLILCIIYISLVAIFIFQIVIVVKSFKTHNATKCAFASLMISLLVCFGLHVMLRISEKSFEKFSIDSWRCNKDQRYLMLDDLETNYNIIGCSFDQMYQLLGTPDYWGNSYYEYSSGLRTIEIYYANGKISKIRHRSA